MQNFKGMSYIDLDEIATLHNLLASIQKMNYYKHDAIASMMEVCNPDSLGYSEKLCDAIHNLMQACMQERDADDMLAYEED